MAFTIPVEVLLSNLIIGDTYTVNFSVASSGPSSVTPPSLVFSAYQKTQKLSVLVTKPEVEIGILNVIFINNRTNIVDTTSVFIKCEHEPICRLLTPTPTKTSLTPTPTKTSLTPTPTTTPTETDRSTVPRPFYTPTPTPTHHLLCEKSSVIINGYTGGRSLGDMDNIRGELYIDIRDYSAPGNIKINSILKFNDINFGKIIVEVVWPNKPSFILVNDPLPSQTLDLSAASKKTCTITTYTTDLLGSPGFGLPKDILISIDTLRITNSPGSSLYKYIIEGDVISDETGSGIQSQRAQLILDVDMSYTANMGTRDLFSIFTRNPGQAVITTTYEDDGLFITDINFNVLDKQGTLFCLTPTPTNTPTKLPEPSITPSLSLSPTPTPTYTPDAFSLRLVEGIGCDAERPYKFEWGMPIVPSSYKISTYYFDAYYSIGTRNVFYSYLLDPKFVSNSFCFNPKVGYLADRQTSLDNTAFPDIPDLYVGAMVSYRIRAKASDTGELDTGDFIGSTNYVTIVCDSTADTAGYWSFVGASMVAPQAPSPTATPSPTLTQQPITPTPTPSYTSIPLVQTISVSSMRNLYSTYKKCSDIGSGFGGGDCAIGEVMFSMDETWDSFDATSTQAWKFNDIGITKTSPSSIRFYFPAASFGNYLGENDLSEWINPDTSQPYWNNYYYFQYLIQKPGQTPQIITTLPMPYVLNQGIPPHLVGQFNTGDKPYIIGNISNIPPSSKIDFSIGTVSFPGLSQNVAKAYDVPQIGKKLLDFLGSGDPITFSFQS